MVLLKIEKHIGSITDENFIVLEDQDNAREVLAIITGSKEYKEIIENSKLIIVSARVVTSEENSKRDNFFMINVGFGEVSSPDMVVIELATS